MKRIKRSLSSFLTSICSTLLALLGYSCSASPDEPDLPTMYGMPTGDFEIKGAVTDEDGANVSDAKIRVTYTEAFSGVFSLQTTTTNTDGQYLAEGESSGFPELKVVCIPSSPTLEADSVIVKLNYNKDKAGSWYVGHAKETVNFKLKSKTPEKE